MHALERTQGTASWIRIGTTEQQAIKRSFSKDFVVHREFPRTLDIPTKGNISPCDREICKPMNYND
jgi:hypothetical protein